MKKTPFVTAHLKILLSEDNKNEAMAFSKNIYDPMAG